MTPRSTSAGTSAASHGANPKHSACAIPKCGAFFAHSGLNSGSSISNGVAGYVTGTSNCRANSYLTSSWTYQHFPLHFVPSLLLLTVNQSLSFALFDCTYPMSAVYSSLRRATHASPSRGPALCVSSGIFLTVDSVLESHDSMAAARRGMCPTSPRLHLCE
eukprot:31539-Pelagococcus_subviridis.AAC.7